MFLHLSPEQAGASEQVQALVRKRSHPGRRKLTPGTSSRRKATWPSRSRPAQAVPSQGIRRDKADATTLCLVIEEISKASPASSLLVFPTQAVIRTIREVGTEEQKQRFFSDMSAGDKLAGFCLTEPNYGSDAGSLQTRAVLEGGPLYRQWDQDVYHLGPPRPLLSGFCPDRPGKRTAASAPRRARGIPRDCLSAGKRKNGPG